jgi:predicted alpha/beta superfamily hydrolase
MLKDIPQTAATGNGPLISWMNRFGFRIVIWTASLRWLCCVALAFGCSGRAEPASSRASAPAITAAAGAPPGPDAIVVGERMSLRSEVLGEERRILVYRPPPERPDARYPVIYLLDGEWHFHHATGLVQFLMQQDRMARVIVVGLANVDRSRDFTPTHVEQMQNSGGADRFLAFVERELIPAVEQAYPTAPYRILVGHSLAGLFALHALSRRPELFDATIAISPSLAWSDRLTQKQTEALLAARPALDRVLYFAVGGEPAEMMESNRAYAALLRARAPRMRWQFEEMPEEDHGSVVHRAIYRGLEHVFAGWRVPQDAASLAQLEAHAAAMSARFHVSYLLPEDTLNALGYRLLAAGKIDDAVAALRRNAELYPDSANVHDSLGEALEQKGDLEAAIQSYEKAVNAAAINRDPFVAAYKSHLERARAKAKK